MAFKFVIGFARIDFINTESRPTIENRLYLLSSSGQRHLRGVLVMIFVAAARYHHDLLQYMG